MFHTLTVSIEESIYYKKVDYSKCKALETALRAKNFNLEELLRIQNIKRKTEWLSIRNIISQVMPLPEDIVYDEHKKPFFKYSASHLSISHSKEMIAIAVNKTQTVGIDLQYISEKIIRIKNKFLDHNEAQVCSDDPIELTMYWTIKEALFKLYGKKDAFLRENMKVTSIQFNGKDGKATGQLNIGSIQDTFQFKLKKLENYILAYSVNS